MDEQQNEQLKQQPAASEPAPEQATSHPPQVGMSRGAIIFVIAVVAIAIIFSLLFSGVFGLYGGPGG